MAKVRLPGSWKVARIGIADDLAPAFVLDLDVIFTKQLAEQAERYDEMVRNHRLV